jgi:DNA-binding transcriptional LysR family regulator
MELGQLRHFLAVIDCGSLGEAARKLDISQGALSKSIQALEGSVGTILFERSKQGMLLTPFGESLEARARVITAEAARAREDLQSLAEGLTGRIAFAIGDASANAILPQAIARFSRSHPLVQLAIRDGRFRDLLPSVKNGKLEFGIFMLTDPSFGRSLSVEILFPHNPVVVATSAQNPIVGRRNVPLKDVWGEPWIVALDGYHSWLVEAFRGVGLPPPIPRIEISAGSLPRNIVNANPRYLFIASELSIREDIEAGRLKIVDIDGPRWKRELAIYNRKDTPLSAAATSFLSVVRAVVSDISRR